MHFGTPGRVARRVYGSMISNPDRESHQFYICMGTIRGNSIPKNTVTRDKKFWMHAETESRGERRYGGNVGRRTKNTDSVRSVHLKLEERSHRFFQVRGFFFLIFAFLFQLGQQVLSVSWQAFANGGGGIH